MPCYEYLSMFSKPYKFPGLTCYISRINYDTNQLEQHELTNPSDYRLASACPNPVHLQWVNRKCGRDEFVFTGKKNEYLETSGSIIFRNQEDQEEYSSRGEIRGSVRLISQYISVSDRIALQGLLTAKDVWMIVDDEGVPVRIADSSFDLSKQSSGLVALQLTIVYSQLIQVQTA
jgi:hypothetical protein